jgi:hypothetical protein
LAAPFRLLQSEWWRRVKERSGWRGGGDPAAGTLVLERSIGPLRFAYVPHGLPDATPSPAAIGDAVELLRAVAGAPRDGSSPGEAGLRDGPPPHLIRWDVPWGSDAFDREAATAAGLTPAPVRVQPPDTVVVDLGGGAETVLAGMRQKTRYNVRLAEKRGVTVATYVGAAAREELPRWYGLYRETAARDRITIHPMAYYAGVFAAAEEVAREGAPVPDLALLLAAHGDDLLAGVVLASWQGMTTYLYGASSNLKRNLMASYLVQWEGMRRAIDGGDTAYDLFGIPPANDPSHPMHGLYRFKTGFGGEIIHRPGCWDIDLSPSIAGTYRTAERLRGWYHYRVRKRGR